MFFIKNSPSPLREAIPDPWASSSGCIHWTTTALTDPRLQDVVAHRKRVQLVVVCDVT